MDITSPRLVDNFSSLLLTIRVEELQCLERAYYEVSSEATQGKARVAADKRIAKPLSQGLLTQGFVVK